MKCWLWLFCIGWALAAPVLPLPNVPALPDASRVEVIGQDLKVKHATGVVSRKTLTLVADRARLPASSRVQVWIAAPGEDVQNIAGVVNATGKDILLEVGKDKVSFEETLREAYGVRLEWKAP